MLCVILIFKPGAVEHLDDYLLSSWKDSVEEGESLLFMS